VFAQRILDAIDGQDGWVIDGNYHSRIGDLVLERADTLVWLDLPLQLCLRRVVRRTLRRIRTNEELWSSGNRERIWTAFVMRNSLVHWTVKSYFRHRRDWPEQFAHHEHLDFVHLQSPEEVNRWLATLTIDARRQRGYSPSQ